MRRKVGRDRKVSLGMVLSQIFPVLLCWGFLAAVGILHVASRSQVVDAAYRLSSMEGENRSLLLDNDKLKLELATLKRPARLEVLARTRLGMAPPEAGAVDSVLARHPVVARAAEGRRTAADRPTLR